MVMMMPSLPPLLHSLPSSTPSLPASGSTRPPASVAGAYAICSTSLGFWHLKQESLLAKLCALHAVHIQSPGRMSRPPPPRPPKLPPYDCWP